MTPTATAPRPAPDVLSDDHRMRPNSKPPKPTPKKHVAPDKRTLLHALMVATAGNAYDWNYREVRPLTMPPKLVHGVNADCSFGVKVLCDWAGVPDPTGGNYDGYGNSTSIFHHLAHVPLADARTGDILLFGPEGSWHAAMVLEPGKDPMLWSHGHQGSPNLYPLSADARRPVTVCRIEAD